MAATAQAIKSFAESVVSEHEMLKFAKTTAELVHVSEAVGTAFTLELQVRRSE